MQVDSDQRLDSKTHLGAVISPRLFADDARKHHAHFELPLMPGDTIHAESRTIRLLGLAAVTLFLLPPMEMAIADSPSFESDWSFAAGDCGLRVEACEKLPAGNRRPSANLLTLTAGSGSQALASFALNEKPHVISELQVRLMLKASRPGLQLFVRAVLPRATNLDDGSHRTIMLPGPTYSQAGEWSTLELQDLPALLERQVRIHRVNSDEWLDIREAFIDLVAVNVYGGRGETQVWLATPDVEGVVVSRSPLETELANVSRLPAPQNHRVQASNGIITIDDRPFAPRVIRPQGEAWPFIKDLGFNTLWLATPPTAEQMAMAERLKLWLIAPVPAVPSLQVLNSHLYRRVIAWDLGSGVPDKYESQQDLADQIRDACGSDRKPLLCVDFGDLEAAERFCDIVVYQTTTLGTSLSLTDYSLRLRHRIDKSVPNICHWVLMSSHLPPALPARYPFGPATPRRQARRTNQLSCGGQRSPPWGAGRVAFASRTRIGWTIPMCKPNCELPLCDNSTVYTRSSAPGCWAVAPPNFNRSTIDCKWHCSGQTAPLWRYRFLDRLTISFVPPRSGGDQPNSLCDTIPILRTPTSSDWILWTKSAANELRVEFASKPVTCQKHTQFF